MNPEYLEEVLVFERLKNQGQTNSAREVTVSQVQACPPDEKVLLSYQGIYA